MKRRAVTQRVTHDNDSTALHPCSLGSLAEYLPDSAYSSGRYNARVRFFRGKLQFQDRITARTSGAFRRAKCLTPNRSNSGNSLRAVY